MKALIQRVSSAAVTVNNSSIGSIDQGLLVFLGVGPNDTKAIADALLKKIIAYRIFSDTAGKMNLSLDQVDGQLLVISQFTLMADTDKGLRPGFSQAADVGLANNLYQYFVDQARSDLSPERVACGEFGADMQVSLCNDGPVTFLLESN